MKEQKNIFLIGTGLLYMWSNLFRTGETFSLVFYWSAYIWSIVGIYFFSNLFTNNKKSKVLSILLFLTASITFNYATYTLIQEFWFGLILLCFIYFLIINLRSEKLIPHIPLLTGSALAVLLFLKNTGIYFIPLVLLIITANNNRIKRFKYILLGFSLTIILSGYIVYLTQNTILYGNPFGTPTFRKFHQADLTSSQILIHFVRFPFILIESPLLPSTINQMIGNLLQSITLAIESTISPNQKNSISLIEPYFYSPSTLKSRFNLGGFVWLITILYTLIWLFEKEKDKKNLLVYGSFLLVILIQFVTIRWHQNAEVPIKHLISSFILFCGYLSYFFKRKSSLSSIVIYFLIIYLCITIIMQIGTAFSILFDSFDGIRKHNQFDNESTIYTQKYVNWLKTLQSPTSFILIENHDLLDYPFFWYKNNLSNKVYLINNRKGLTISNFAKILKIETMNKRIEYIVFLRSSETELINILLTDHDLFDKISLPQNTPLIIIQNKQYNLLVGS